MFRAEASVNFAQVEKHVAWLRSAEPHNVVERAASALLEGAPEDVLWAAGVVTALRYVNNQAHNLLGFVSHALIGSEDARRLAYTQDRRIHHLLLLQALHQVVFDLHDPCLSPYELLPCKPLFERSVSENIRLLRMDVRMGEYLRADHRFVALAQEMERDALVDLLLDIGLEGIVTDDHTLISPVLCLGLIDLLGWEEGFKMLRCALRYSASFPRNFAPYDRALALMKAYNLEGGAPVRHFQPDRVQALRQAFHAATPQQRPEIAARALAVDGCSPETVLAAVSITGCDFYLMAEPVPHEDFDAISREVAPIHIGTSTNALRSGLRYMSPRTQVIAALQGGSLLERGPSVLNAEFEFVPFTPAPPFPYPDDVEALHEYKPAELLRSLEDSLYQHDYRRATAAVRAYADSGAAPAPLISTLIAVACTDQGTLLHSVKHLNAMIKEFWSFDHTDRWQYPIAAARFIAWYAGLNAEVYNRAVRELEPETH